jgi:hypothetical protein
VEREIEHYGTGWYTRLLGTGWLPLTGYQSLEARCPIHHRYDLDPTKLFHNYPFHPGSKTRPTVGGSDHPRPALFVSSSPSPCPEPV